MNDRTMPSVRLKLHIAEGSKHLHDDYGKRSLLGVQRDGVKIFID